MSKSEVGLGKTTWLHIRRSPFQSLSAILIMWLNFLTATALIVLVLGFSSLLGYFESRPEVTAFLKDGTTDAQIQQLKGKISDIEGVKEVRFVSKEDALNIYREQNKDNPLLLEMVNAAILPASIEISATSPTLLTQIAEIVKEEKSVIEEVVFQKDVVEKLSFWVKAIRNGGIAIVGFLTVVSLAVTMIIVGMKISAHRDEINALRSLGATNSYIQSPFLLEGIFYGFFGALLGWALIFGAVFIWQSQIDGFFYPIVVVPKDINLLIIIFASEMLSGCLLGLTAAWLASKRYLKR